jgi:hypothetical protein
MNGRQRTSGFPHFRVRRGPSEDPLTFNKSAEYCDAGGRAMLRFRQMKSHQKFASVHANVHNHFNL